MTINYKAKTILNTLLACTILSSGLVACGGGSGSGGSSGGSTAVTPPPPPPPPSSSVADEFPDNFEVSLQEGDAFQSVITDIFTITAPSTTEEVTASVDQTGDGQFFALRVISSDPNAQGIRDVQLEFTSTADLDFETPQDSNGDNIYEFAITGQYINETLTANVALTVTDDTSEPVSITPRVIEGSLPGQRLGDRLTTILLPGLAPERALGVVTGGGQGVASILREEFIEREAVSGSYLTGLETLPDSQDYGTQFLSTFNTNDHQISGLDTGTGITSLLLSVANSQDLFLYDIAFPDGADDIKGDIDPLTTRENRAVYSFPSDILPVGKLIPDVNNDGNIDIFVYDVEPSFPDRRMGIIFGEGPIDSTNQDRSTDFDITFTFFGTPMGLTNDIIPVFADLDGDTLEDLIIISPGASGPAGLGAGRIWAINGSVLRDPATTTIDLDSLTSQQGASLSGEGDLGFSGAFTNDSSIGMSFVTGFDADGDGIPQLLFTDRNSALYAIDGDDFLNLGNTDMQGFYAGGGYRITSFDTAAFNFASKISLGPNLKGVFTPELVIVDDSGRIAKIFDNDDILATAATAANNPQDNTNTVRLGNAPLITLDFNAFANPALTGGSPEYIESNAGGAGTLIFPDSSANDNRGRLFIINAITLDEAISEGTTVLSLVPDTP